MSQIILCDLCDNRLSLHSLITVDHPAKYKNEKNITSLTTICGVFSQSLASLSHYVNYNM